MNLGSAKRQAIAFGRIHEKENDSRTATTSGKINFVVYHHDQHRRGMRSLMRGSIQERIWFLPFAD
jgi:hypothetical protein